MQALAVRRISDIYLNSQLRVCVRAPVRDPRMSRLSHLWRINEKFHSRVFHLISGTDKDCSWNVLGK